MRIVRNFTMGLLMLLMASNANAALVAHWTFDEANGTTAFDSVGNVNGTLVGGVVFSESGILGGAIQIADGYVDMGNNFASASSFSVQAWIKTEPGDLSPMTPVSKHWSGWANGYYISINNVNDGYTNTGLAGFRSMNSTYNPTATGGPVVNNGTWHQIVGTYDNGTSSLYVDGDFVDSTYPNGYSDSSVSLLIGGCNDFYGQPGNLFHGFIDDVRIYDNALSEDDVHELYVNAVPIPSTLLLFGFGITAITGMGIRRKR